HRQVGLAVGAAVGGLRLARALDRTHLWHRSSYGPAAGWFLPTFGLWAGSPDSGDGEHRRAARSGGTLVPKPTRPPGGAGRSPTSRAEGHDPRRRIGPCRREGEQA